MPRADGTPTNAELRKYLKQYVRGDRSKSEIERTELGISNHRGKTLTRTWYNRLGVDTFQGQKPAV